MQNSNIFSKHGGYRKLLTYQKAEIIFDATTYFCNTHIKKYTRTHDQMIQAARSGKQNIAEASMASATSKETEIKLTNVARASLEELLIDYEDFMRTNKIVEWESSHPYNLRFNQLNKTPNANYDTFKKAIENPNLEIATNVIKRLINVTTYLLSKQLTTLEKQFLQDGGFKERLSQARKSHPKK